MKSYCRTIFFILFLLSLFLFSNISTISAKDFSWGYADITSNTQYKYQWSDKPNKLVSSDSDDQDIYEILSGEIGNNSKDLTFSFLGRYAKDLDGTTEGSIYQDFTDGGRERQRLDIYYAYIEKELFNKLDVKLGRQFAYSSEIVNFDGLSVSGDGIGPRWLNFEAFGGSIVQTYENLNRDGIGGLNLDFNFIKNLTIYVDSVFYRRNSYEGGFYWKPLPYLKAKGSWSLINTNNRQWDLNVIATCPKTKTTINVDIYKHFRIKISDDFLYDYTTKINTNAAQEIRRLYLGRELGYIDYSISITQPIPTQEGMSVFIKYTKRDLYHDYYEDYYNTDFYRWTGGFSLENWKFLKGTKFNIGYSYWKEQRHNLYESTSKSIYGDIEQEIGEKLSIAGGFYYKTEDVNSLIEGEAAHYYYGKLRYKFSEENYAEVKYEYETDDYYHEYGIDGINAITLTLNYNF